MVMKKSEINPLILEKIASDVKDASLRSFIEEILIIEQDYPSKRGKMREYEKALAKHMRSK